MIGPPERAAGEQIALLRSVGYAAFGRHERDLDVLDLVFDSLVDAPGSTGDEVRRLRFAGHGITLDVDVRGQADLTVELRVSPSGPVVVESRGADERRTDGGPAGQLPAPLAGHAHSGRSGPPGSCSDHRRCRTGPARIAASGGKQQSELLQAAAADRADAADRDADASRRSRRTAPAGRPSACRAAAASDPAGSPAPAVRRRARSSASSSASSSGWSPATPSKAADS